MKLRTLASCLLLSLSLGFLPGLAQDVAAAEKMFLTGKVMAMVTRVENAPFAGIVDEVLVKTGQHVKKDDVVMRYILQDGPNRSLSREVGQGPDTMGVEQTLVALEQDLVRAQAQRAKARSLSASGMGSSSALSRIEKECAAISNRIELNRKHLAKIRSNYAERMKELSRYFDQKMEAGMELPQYLYLKASIDGYVISVDINARPGTAFGGGWAPIEIGQLDTMRIQVSVFETEIPNIKVGDKAVVKITSLNDKPFDAVVTDISWKASDMRVNTPSFYNVEFSIQNTNLELKPGFKAVVELKK